MEGVCKHDKIFDYRKVENNVILDVRIMERIIEEKSSYCVIVFCILCAHACTKMHVYVGVWWDKMKQAFLRRFIFSSEIVFLYKYNQYFHSGTNYL